MIIIKKIITKKNCGGTVSKKSDVLMIVISNISFVILLLRSFYNRAATAPKYAPLLFGQIRVRRNKKCAANSKLRTKNAKLRIYCHINRI